MSSLKRKNEEQACYRMILNYIKNMIHQGKLKDGEKLPPERKLAEQFNVSRIPIREALKILEFMGIVENRSNGLYVKKIGLKELIEKIDFTFDIKERSVLDILELRHALDAMAAGYAAIRRSGDDMDFLKNNLESMRELKKNFTGKAEELQRLRLLSHQFHRGIVAASKNDVLLSIYESLFALLDISRQWTIGDSGISYNSILAHEAILYKIEQQDSVGAQRSMTEHLTEAAERLKVLFKEHASTIENNPLPEKGTS
ncbi:FadR family transcriptional regulator [Fretibacterium sp. OH1220_COT-178]|nr:FadR family transcriptional regulator [Fretibacterium sp. OH1220_COT-178]